LLIIKHFFKCPIINKYKNHNTGGSPLPCPHRNYTVIFYDQGCPWKYHYQKHVSPPVCYVAYFIHGYLPLHTFLSIYCSNIPSGCIPGIIQKQVNHGVSVPGSPCPSCPVLCIQYFIIKVQFPRKSLLTKPVSAGLPNIKYKLQRACQPQKHIKFYMAAVVISCFHVLYKNGKRPASRII